MADKTIPTVRNASNGTPFNTWFNNYFSSLSSRHDGLKMKAMTIDRKVINQSINIRTTINKIFTYI